MRIIRSNSTGSGSLRIWIQSCCEGKLCIPRYQELTCHHARAGPYAGGDAIISTER